MLGYRPKLKNRRVESPRGVSGDEKHVVHCVHGKQIEYETIYHGPLRVVNCEKYNKGVMRKGELVYNKKDDNRSSKRVFMLHFSKPCLCGSLLHSSTRSSDCFLNKKYYD